MTDWIKKNEPNKLNWSFTADGLSSGQSSGKSETSWQAERYQVGKDRVLSDVEKGVRVCPENLDLTHAGGSKIMNIY